MIRYINGGVFLIFVLHWNEERRQEVNTEIGSEVLVEISSYVYAVYCICQYHFCIESCPCAEPLCPTFHFCVLLSIE